MIYSSVTLRGSLCAHHNSFFHTFLGVGSKVPWSSSQLFSHIFFWCQTDVIHKKLWALTTSLWEIGSSHNFFDRDWTGTRETALPLQLFSAHHSRQFHSIAHTAPSTIFYISLTTISSAPLWWLLSARTWPISYMRIAWQRACWW